MSTASRKYDAAALQDFAERLVCCDQFWDEDCGLWPALERLDPELAGEILATLRVIRPEIFAWWDPSAAAHLPFATDEG